MDSPIIEFFRDLLKPFKDGVGDIKPPQVRKVGILVVTGILGILLLLFSFSSRLMNPPISGVDSKKTYQDKGLSISLPGELSLAEEGVRLEKDLEEILSHVQGAGRVNVKIMFESGRFYDYAENETYEENTSRELDAQGLERKTTQVRKAGEIVTTQERSGSPSYPLVRNFKAPRIQGVLVIAEGAKDTAIKRILIEAVTTLFDIPYHKVAVLPRKR